MTKGPRGMAEMPRLFPHEIDALRIVANGESIAPLMTVALEAERLVHVDLDKNRTQLTIRGAWVLDVLRATGRV